MKQKDTEVKLTLPHKGESSGERGQRGKRHEVAVRRRALLLHRLLHAVAVGDHRIAVQMPRRVRRLHGENAHTHTEKRVSGHTRSLLCLKVLAMLLLTDLCHLQDMRNRSVSLNLLLELSERQHLRQFIFITPLSTR